MPEKIKKQMASIAASTRRSIERLWIAGQCYSPGSELHLEFTNPDIGFFAQMNFCLYAARIAQRQYKRLFITLSSENYRDPAAGPCWFHYFFEERHGIAPRQGRRPIKIKDNSQLPVSSRGLSLEEARSIFFDHFALRADVQKTLDDITDRLSIGTGTLGVHFRATDKFREADQVEPDRAINEIRSLIASLPDVRNIFVASDNANFIRRVHAEIVEVPVVSLNDSARSLSDVPLHLNRLKEGNRALGEDALLNSLALSRCGWLLRTSSFLSAWSSVFNPDIPVILLNEPHPGKLWFPESCIVDRATLLIRR